MLSLFPRDVLDEIWDLIESVSEGCPTYFYVLLTSVPQCQKYGNNKHNELPVFAVGRQYLRLCHGPCLKRFRHWLLKFKKLSRDVPLYC